MAGTRKSQNAPTLAVDTSALVAILKKEPEAELLGGVMRDASRRVLSSANYVELGTVLAGVGSPSMRRQVSEVLDRFLASASVGVVPVTEEMARLALKARVRFGKGFGHRGGLNYGDSFSYALAKSLDAPLLYVGEDFARTDVKSAL